MDANQFFMNEVSPVKELRSMTLWKGQKNILNNKEEDPIMSLKGTVRGVKNRVRAGIATFLEDKSKRVRKQEILNIVKTTTQPQLNSNKQNKTTNKSTKVGLYTIIGLYNHLPERVIYCTKTMFTQTYQPYI